MSAIARSVGALRSGTLVDVVPPPLVFVTFTDDEKQGDGMHKMITGFRSGEEVCKDIFDLEARGMFIPNFWCTRGLCMPSRTEILTGLTRMNHGCENGSDYRYNFWIVGQEATRDLATNATASNWSSGTTYGLYDIAKQSGDTYVSLALNNLNHSPSTNPTWWQPLSQFQGPFYRDFSLQAGLPETPVAPANQPLATTVSNVRVVPTYSGGTTYALNALVNSSGQNYISLANGNVGHTPASSPTFWAATTAKIGRGSSVSVVDDLQYSTGNVFTYLPDHMTPNDVTNGRPDIKKCWVGKGDTYDGSIASPAPYNAADPLGDRWNGSTTYALGASVHDGYFFYSSRANGNVGHQPTKGATDANWSLVGAPLTTRWAQPGIHFIAILNGDGLGEVGDVVDYWHNEYFVYDATTMDPNPRDGDGVVADLYAFDYDQPLTSITWDAGSARAFVTLTNPLGYLRNGSFVAENLVVGDEVAIAGTTGGAAAYNGRGWIVDQVVSNTQFYVRLDAAGAAVTNGGTWNTAGAFAYPRKYYTAQLDKRWLNRFLDTLTLADPAFVYYCPRMPHGEVNDTGAPPHAQDDGNPPFEMERRYFETVDASESTKYAGVPGAYSPANDELNYTADPQRDNHAKVYRCRGELLAGWNDIMCRDSDAIVPRLDRERVTAWKWYRWSDNGWQEGGHEDTDSTQAWSRVDGKDMVWSESCNVPLFVIDPDFPGFVAGGTLQDGPFIPADMCPTLLHIFSLVVDPTLANHPARTKKDGVSMYEFLASAGNSTIRNRLIPSQGRYLQDIWTGASPTNVKGGLAVMDRRGFRSIRRFDDLDGSGGSWKRFDENIPAWDSGTTYGLYALVSVGGVNYVSLQATNVNHSPASSPTFWQVARGVATTPEITNLVTGTTGAFDAITTDMQAALNRMFFTGRWDGTTNGMKAAYTGS